MVSDIGNSSAINQLMSDIFKNVKAADTDGIGGLSKKELMSIDASGSVGKSAFLDSLATQFDSLDADANGQLTVDEMVQSKPKGPMGPPPGLDLGCSGCSANYVEQLLEKLKESMAQAVLTDMTKADTDGTEGLSAQELSSIASDNADSGDIVDKVLENFKDIDSDKSGQLSSEELLSFLNSSEAKKINETANTSSDGDKPDKDNSKGEFIGKFFEKLIDNYGSKLSELDFSKLPEMISSLNISV